MRMDYAGHGRGEAMAQWWQKGKDSGAADGRLTSGLMEVKRDAVAR
jgi:hypothetical protein